MSELNVDTINEQTAANGVTIDGVLIKDGQVDGVDVSAITSNPAFDEIDLWEWSSNITASANPISANLQRKSYTLMSYPKGTGMSVSSGLWTFPSTGFYEVRIAGIFYHQANSNSVQLYIYATDDNNSTSSIISKDDNRAGSGTWHYFDLENTVKISNTSNDKVYFRLNIGGTTPTGTFYAGSNCIISFKKLGDI